jgi:hypothetical protein
MGNLVFDAMLVDMAAQGRRGSPIQLRQDGDAVANERSVPFDRISLETIDRGLYHFIIHLSVDLGSEQMVVDKL